MGSRPALYIAPKPPTPGGIADYAGRFREALSVAGVAYDEVTPAETVPTAAEVSGIRREVGDWQSTGKLRTYRLAHLELAAFSYREYFYARALANTKLPLLLTIHDPRTVVAEPFGYRGWKSKPLPFRIARKMLEKVVTPRRLRRLLTDAAALVVLGEAGRKDLVANWGVADSNVRVIRHVTYPVRPRKRTDATVRILFSGFADPSKGLDLLMEALAGLLGRRPEVVSKVRLTVVGGTFKGAGKHPVEALIRTYPVLKPVVTYPGFVGEPELEQIYADTDISVIPYRAEVPGSSSAILMRAMSAGNAVVVSDRPSLTQDVVDRKTGLVFPMNDGVALAERLEHLIDDSELRQALGRAARKQVETNNNPQAVGEAIRRVYDSVAS